MNFRIEDEFKEAALPSWQSGLLLQIVSAVDSYYCHPESFNSAKRDLINSLTNAFHKINAELKKDGKPIDSAPSTSERYQEFLQVINPILEKFDSHMHLDYRPEFISEVKQNNQVIAPQKNARSPKFDLGNQPPDKQLFEWNKAQLDPRNNYGFVDDPNICSLHVIADTAIGKKFHHTPTYVLGKDGLFFIGRSDQEVSPEHLVISNKDNDKYLAVCEALPVNNNSPYGVVLQPNQQAALTAITNHHPPKNDVPDNIGYLKINYLLEPHFGEQKETDYQLGPNAVKVLNAIMQKFKDKGAIILDLRNAPQGGSPTMTHYLISFFIAQKGLLIDEIVDRRFAQSDKFFVKDTPVQLFDKPVDILTDETTFSAREAIAFHMQRLNKQLQQEHKQEGDRFQLIGTKTKGGAHPSYSFPLAAPSGEVNKDLILWLPCAASKLKDWEGVGVVPDKQIKVNEDALKIAVAHLSTLPSLSENQFPINALSKK